MNNTITRIWRSGSSSFLISLLALACSVAAFLVTVSEAFSNFAESCSSDPSCHEPRDWIMLPFGLLGLALLAIAAVTLLRSLYLGGRHIRRTLGGA